ncbi:hypothetical protein BHM03_00056289 [Ensete ventricosum]|nr:hypothetical protein BHM03_00056289 [Ensete ventricosum]
MRKSTFLWFFDDAAWLIQPTMLCQHGYVATRNSWASRSRRSPVPHSSSAHRNPNDSSLLPSELRLLFGSGVLPSATISFFFPLLLVVFFFFFL